MMDTHINRVTKEEIRAARVTGLYEYLEACHHDDFKNVGTTMLIFLTGAMEIPSTF